VTLSNDLKVTSQDFRRAANATSVKHALGVIDAKFQTDEQQDAHECLTTILCGVSQELQQGNEDELFGFIVQVRYPC
jgi:uncharacterized UBP type Zn finger protein